MRVKWRQRRSRRPGGGLAYTCEVRRSEKRARPRQPLRQRKITVVHLGTLAVGPDAKVETANLAHFWDRVYELLGYLEISPNERTRLVRQITTRCPLFWLREEIRAERVRAWHRRRLAARRHARWLPLRRHGAGSKIQTTRCGCRP